MENVYFSNIAIEKPYISINTVEEENILKAIREVCSGLALSDRARAARYDKIVEILKEKNDV